MELKTPDQIVRQRAAIVRETGQRVFDVLTAAAFEEALHTVALEIRLAAGAHQCAISYVPLGDFHAAIHTHSFSEKYAKYNPYDVMPTGQGIWGLVVREKKTVLMSAAELNAHPLWANFSGLKDARGLEHPPMRGWLAAPVLRPNGELLGVLQLSDKDGDADFTSADLDLLVHLTHMVWTTFELHYVNEQLARRTDDLRRSTDKLELRIRERTAELTTANEALGEEVRQRQRADANILASQGVLQLILDSIPQGVFWKDRQSRFLGCNQVVCRAFGLERPEQIVGLDDHHLPGLTREQTDFFIRKDRQVMEANTPEFGIIEQATFADGTSVWLETSKIPIHDAAGQVVGILGTFQNITERKRAEETLRASEALLRSITDSSEDMIFVKDRASRILLMNPAGYRIVGLTPEALLGRTDAECHSDPVQAAAFMDADRRVMESRRAETSEEEFTSPSGARHVLLTAKTPRLDAQGNVIGIVGIGRDITERNRAKEALRASEELLRLANESAGIGTYDTDLKAGISRYSPELCAILGLPAGTEIPVGEAVKIVHPDDLERVTAVIQRSRDPAGDGLARSEHRIVRPSGEVRWLVWRGRTLFRDTPAGRVPVRSIGSCFDITERKQAEEERRKLLVQLLHVQKSESLGVLAGGIAHDFNNLLTGILGYADLALRELPPGISPHNYIEGVVKGARRAAELTQQMLAYSGKGRFVVQPLNLSTLVADMSHLLEVSISKKCVLKHNFTPNLPACEADAAQLRQIIMNFIINASEAIGDRSGVIAVATGAMHCDRTYLSGAYFDENLPEGQYVYLEVADTGCGMSEETRAKIFEPFFTTKFTGRGLGLAAVLGIVRGHRGAIKVYSQLGKGTTFRVLLPASSQPVAIEKVPSAQTEEWRGSGTVLIVDDEESVRTLACQMMETMGFTVVTAADGREGVAWFRAEAARIRLVLLDLTMPHMDGEETFRALRRIRSDVLVILSSGFGEQSATSHFVGQGLAGFIQKPYRFEELRAEVRKVLEKKAGSNA